MLRTSYSMPHIISPFSEVVNHPLPADAATIPADARVTFHLPPAVDTPCGGQENTREGYYDNPNRSLNGIMASK